MDLNNVQFKNALPRRSGKAWMPRCETRIALHHGGKKKQHCKISITIGRNVVKSLRWQRNDRVDHAWDWVDGKLIVHLWRSPNGDLALSASPTKSVQPNLICGLVKHRVEETIERKLRNVWGIHETEHQIMESDNSLVMAASFPEMMDGEE